MRAKRIIAGVFISVSFLAVIIAVMLLSVMSYEEDYVLMGTNIRIEIKGIQSKKAGEEIKEYLANLDNKISTSKDKATTSYVYKFNMAKKDEPIEVDDEFITLYKQSKQLYDLSNGSFDITTNPLSDVWEFSPDKYVKDKSGYKPPLKSDIEEAQKHIGFNKIQLNERTKTIKKLEDDVSIDFGGVAKGYASDEAKKIVEKYKVSKALLNIGGNLFILKFKAKIAIQDPRISNKSESYLGVLELEDKTIVTSGDYERYYDVEGKRYHHILNPKTGEPAQSGIVSASIIGNESWLCDGLATIAVLNGEEEITKIIKDKGMSAILVKEKGKGYEIVKIGNSYKFEYNSKDLNEKYSVRK